MTNSIDLALGRGAISVQYDPDRFEVLTAGGSMRALADIEISSRLDTPIGTPTLEDIVEPGETVLIVVPDATRQAAAGQIVNLVVRRLIANGTLPSDIRTIFATGIHRQVTEAERATILTPFIAQRINSLVHDARDLAQLVRLGETSHGVPIELNRALLDHDRVVLVGAVAFHYFAGFTGGRKLVCPGLGSSRTIAGTHKLAFDCETRSRRQGVGPASLNGNPVHEAFLEIVKKIKPDFCISTIVDRHGAAAEVVCGHWIESHLAACDIYSRARTIDIAGPRNCVIVSCGGYPYDINMIQAHKSLDTAARACTDGGQIVLLADCADGLGRDDFLAWFDARDSRELAGRLCERYQVNGQTAWTLLEKAERCRISVVGSLDSSVLKKMRLTAMEPHQISSIAADAPSGYIIPSGSSLNFTGISA